MPLVTPITPAIAIALVSRTLCSALALLRRGGTHASVHAPLSGTRLCSAPLKERCAASGAREPLERIIA